MPFLIDLPPAHESQLQDEARKVGVTINELVARAIAEKFPVESDEHAQSLRLTEQWIAEAPTDPDQMNEAEEDLRAFQRAVNQNRREAGARLVYRDNVS